MGVHGAMHKSPKFVQLALKTLVGRDTDQDLSAFEVKEMWVQPGTLRVNMSTDCDLIVIQRVRRRMNFC